MEHIAKNLDGRSFTLFIKLFNDLRNNVLQKSTHELSPDSFLMFLQKLEEGLTSMQTVNDIVVNKLEGVDLSLLSTKALLSKYQDLSIDFQFEEKIRMGEIKQFAANVVPKSRFIFDNYKVKEDLYSEEEEPAEKSDGEEESDNFSFFTSHENIILKPESSFKTLRSFLVHLPIDYYILL